MWGSAGANPEATETPERIAEAQREQLVLYTDSEATGTPDLNLHAAPSLEQVGLGSIVPHGCQSWA